MNKRMVVLLVLMLAVALVVAGCAQKTETPASSAGKGSETPAAGGEIAIGFSAGFTGDMAPWAEAMHKAAVLAVDEINAAGGVLGKQLKMYTEDNKSIVEGSVQACQKLIKVNRVNSIIGPESDPIMAVVSMAKENKIPIISTSGGTSALDTVGGTGMYIYRTNASDSFIGVCEAKIMLDELKTKNIVVVYENVEGSTSAAESVIKNFKRFGGNVVDTVVLNSKQSTYNSELKKVASANADMMYISAGQQAAATFLKEKYQKKVTLPMMGASELQTPELVAAAGEGAKGLYTQRIVEKEGSQGWTRFSDAFKAKYGEKPLAGYYQSNTYDAVILVALAMEAAKGTTGADIDKMLTQVSGPPGTKVYSFAEGVAELKKGNDIDFEGASGPVDFNQYGNISAPAVAIMQVNDKLEWTILKTIDASQFPAS